MSTYNYPRASRYFEHLTNSQQHASPSRIRVGTRKDGLWHRALGLLSILASKTLAPVVTTLNAVPCWHLLFSSKAGTTFSTQEVITTNGFKEGTSNESNREVMHS